MSFRALPPAPWPRAPARPRLDAASSGVAARFKRPGPATEHPPPPGDIALAAYEALAPYYDLFTASYEHERWLAQLEALAQEHGLAGRKVLDAACGTGSSFLPWLPRGYEVTGCDLSPAMLGRARERAAGERVELRLADLRSLPQLGQFDLATCLDDALNYLLSTRDLARALAGLARNLRPGGLLIFDLNTLATYRETFCRDSVREEGGVLFCWRGRGDPQSGAASISSALLEVFAPERQSMWRRISSRHVQRHHPPALVRRVLCQAGLEPLAVYGQMPGARLERAADEEVHTKLVYLARKPTRQAEVLARR
jgi:SAM-dependent methyltransferase